jgi:hypothetical protein
MLYLTAVRFNSRKKKFTGKKGGFRQKWAILGQIQAISTTDSKLLFYFLKIDVS